MRVIAGKYKGTKLISPRGAVRPTTDLVKGSMFSVLDSKGLLRGSRVLDVFCGSGALGIEALSRGADSAVFIDADTSNAKANLDKIGLDCLLLKGDFRSRLKQLRGEKFDLIFCDPPYASGFGDITLEAVFDLGLLGTSGAAVFEYASGDVLKIPHGARSVDKRKFGAATFEIFGGDSESDFCGNI